MIYLAVPIKHTDPLVETWRCAVATRAATSLHDAGIPVFSPATHGRGFASLARTRQGWDYWSRIDLPILRCCCTVLAILDLDGWKTSQGVQAEITAAREAGIPIIHINWCTCRALLHSHSHSHTCPCEPFIPDSVIAAVG